MFYVAQEKIGTLLGQQKEYAAAARRNISFFAAEGAWHYLIPSDQIEPSIRQRFETGEDGESLPSHYIWSQRIGIGETIGDPVITPFQPYTPGGDSVDWMETAKARLQASLNAN